ncbi:unnamed protein product, partial [Didymodactylos carnosus]
ERRTPLIASTTTLYRCNITHQYISKHRVKDKKQDCLMNDDENSNINICPYNLNDHFKCFTRNETDYIQRRLVMDGRFDCLDGSDEYFGPTLKCRQHDNMGCRFLRDHKAQVPQIYRFLELCNGYEWIFLSNSLINETDETDCEHWPYSCDSRHTRCDRMWNCKNGTDEKNCDSELNEVPEIPYYSDVINYHFRCTKNEHYCIKFINNFNDINMTCLPLQNAGDGVVDCIGGTDERLTNICTQLNPLEFDKRFYCMNSTVCITPKQVCDGKVDCPFSDDELVCPGLWSSNSTKDHCKDVSLRCPLKSSDSINCPNKEDIWFCDLDTSFSFVEKKMNDLENWYLIDSYPRKMLKTTALDKKTNSFRSKRLVVETSDDSYNLLFWKCNRGILMQTLLNNNDAILECLCSPGYYGDYCQYQSRRITVLLKIVPAIYFNPSIIFRLIIYLLNENDSVVSHEEIVYNSYMHERKKHMVYLIQERFTAQRPLENKIRIDCYLITLSDVQYISSWLFNISFPFFPVNRLAAVIALKNEPLKGYNCKKINCGSNGI